VIAHHNPHADLPLVGVREIVEAHWKKFGRHYYSRYDYEGVETNDAAKVLNHLQTHFRDFSDQGTFFFFLFLQNEIARSFIC
jgi:phosphoglucomutase